MRCMDRPADFWNNERLERMMLAEAARHGASERDLTLLRAEFQKLCDGNKHNNQPQAGQMEIPDDAAAR